MKNKNLFLLRELFITILFAIPSGLLIGMVVRLYNTMSAAGKTFSIAGCAFAIAILFTAWHQIILKHLTGSDKNHPSASQK